MLALVGEEGQKKRYVLWWKLGRGVSTFYPGKGCAAARLIKTPAAELGYLYSNNGTVQKLKRGSLIWECLIYLS
jgi:hypothetical protein